MAFYDLSIHVGRQSSLWDVTLGPAIPGNLRSWSWDYGGDTQKGSFLAKPPVLQFVTSVRPEDEPDWRDGDRCIAQMSFGTQAAFTFFVGLLDEPQIQRGTGRTIISAYATGIVQQLPATVDLAQVDDSATGVLFDDLLEAVGVPAALRRADVTMDRELLQYIANEARSREELQKVVDSQGPPAVWYQTYDGAIYAHARGMLADAVSIGGPSDLQPWGRVEVRQNLRNLINSVNFDVVEVVGSSINVTGSVPFDDPDSVAIYGPQGFRGDRQPFGALAEDDVRDLARTFVRQYANGITERSFLLRLDEDSIASIMGDGTDLSGFYPGRPMFIIGPDGNAELGRVSRVNVRSRATLLIAEVETDSYISSELAFVPSSFTREIDAGNAYSIAIPVVVGGVMPYTYSRVSGPGHASFDPATRIVSGNAPNNPRTQNVVIRATDSSPRQLLGDLTLEGTDPVNNSVQGLGMIEVSGTVYAGLIDDNDNRSYWYSVDLANGDLTALGNHFLGTDAWAGADLININGTVYQGIINATERRFYWYSVDVSDGALTELGTSNLFTSSWRGLGIIESGGSVYVAFISSSTARIYLYTVDIADGTLTAVDDAPSGITIPQGAGLVEVGGTVYAAIISAGTDDLVWSRLSLTDASLTGHISHVVGVGQNRWGVGVVDADDGIYLGLGRISPSGAFELYSVTETGQLSADFTLTLDTV